jgi:hypothetical protein
MSTRPLRDSWPWPDDAFFPAGLGGVLKVRIERGHEEAGSK